MKSVPKVLAMLSIALAVVIAASPLTAQDKKAKEKKKGKSRAGSAYIDRFFAPKGITFSAEQKEKVEALKKDLGYKFREIQNKRRSILTDDQRKARGAAFKSAQEAKKKGKELRAAVNAAVKLTDEQKGQMADVQKEQQELIGKIRKAINEILTDEQRQTLRKSRPKGKSKAKKKKKDK